MLSPSPPVGLCIDYLDNSSLHDQIPVFFSPLSLWAQRERESATAALSQTERDGATAGPQPVLYKDQPSGRGNRSRPLAWMPAKGKRNGGSQPACRLAA